ncbi:MAG: His/Gly/Thr/Pro-type tRNA ligase C-terminal domain-containing protein [Candidatus Methanomethylicia archaeon]|nr:His/Gly/Thr/Pro-type tRNA ligase C-terminal domain-containing protein [Candidatus Methanomethylicia archaeon]
MGAPIAITVDYETLRENTVTIRDRDTWEQSRISVDSIVSFLSDYYKIR